VYTLNGLLSKFVRTVDALREHKEAGAGTAAPAAEPAASAGEDVETA
jgi:hypothetical protein